MHYSVCALSDVGNVRGNNEDMFLVESRTGRDVEYAVRLTSRAVRLFAVADGMGGHAGGEVASAHALDLLVRAREAGAFPIRPGDHGAFQRILQDIHRDIEATGARLPETFGMGTTLVGCLLYPERRLVCFHAGDSRLYRWREGALDRLTLDHSLRAEIDRAGGNSAGVGGHLVTSCLGGGIDQLRVDTAAMPGEVLAADRYLLCSDGLTDMVAEDRIAALAAAPHATQAARDLVAEAKRNGGQDNVTVIVIAAGG